jgi:hypothetical protein
MASRIFCRSSGVVFEKEYAIKKAPNNIGAIILRKLHPFLFKTNKLG